MWRTPLLMEAETDDYVEIDRRVALEAPCSACGRVLTWPPVEPPLGGRRAPVLLHPACASAVAEGIARDLEEIGKMINEEVLWCGACSRAMQTYRRRKAAGGYNHYYRCRSSLGSDACTNRKSHLAPELEHDAVVISERYASRGCSSSSTTGPSRSRRSAPDCALGWRGGRRSRRG